MPGLARLRSLVALSVLAAAAALAQAPSSSPPPSPVAALEQMLATQPDDAVLAFFLGYVKARAGDVDGALEALELALRHGRGLLPTDEAFPALAADARFARMKARFERRLERKVNAHVAFTLRDRLLIPEGIAYDPVGRSFYVGSIARRAVYRVGRGGELVPLSQPGDALDEILGLAVDGASRTLYAVSTNAFTEGTRGARRNAIHAYDLVAGKRVRTFDVPGARQLNDIAIAPGGVILATDSEGGGVWRIDTASGDVRALVPLGSARGANGIAVAPGGRVAYVAANRRPIRLDVATGTLEPLGLPAGENAATIDGLYWHEGALIGVQNFTTPARIVRLALSADGRSIGSVETLQSHHQRAFNVPTTAAIAPDGLYVLARTFVTRYNERRTIDRPESIEAPIVLRIPLARG